MSENIKHAERVKELAGDYAHCYAFVKDETMPLKHAELHAAIDAMQSALDDAVAKLAARDAEVVLLTEQRDEAANELIRRGIWIRFHQALSWAPREFAMGLSDAALSEEVKGGGL